MTINELRAAFPAWVIEPAPAGLTAESGNVSIEFDASAGIVCREMAILLCIQECNTRAVTTEMKRATRRSQQGESAPANSPGERR